ncbi:MAG: peptidyl-prolyl cis-trans isomerase [Calditrichaeota bacterium]|nr:peptidyl-prolyl cis-trans isomerase [Calditrichota bacterium]HQU70919.1 peptidyl-prolyl cis-trans isomerase [Calditrichia bacterium]
MRKSLIRFYMIPLLGLMVCLGACDNEPDEEEVVARVGDHVLTRQVVFQLIPEDVRGSEREGLIRRIVDQWVNNLTIAEVARREGISLTPSEEWHIENLESEMLASKYFQSKSRFDLPVTDQEILDFYNTHKEEFVRNQDEVRLVHLFLEKLDNALVKEVRASKSLLEVIEKNKPIAGQLEEPNGDLGYVPVTQLRSEFQKAIRGEKSGTIYGPVKTKDGHHFLQILDRKESGTVMELALVKEDIARRLKFEKRQEQFRQLTEKARKEFGAETFYEKIF